MLNNQIGVTIMYYNDYDILTIDEVLDYLDIGRNSLYKLLNSGELKAFRIGRNWKIPMRSITEYINESIAG